MKFYKNILRLIITILVATLITLVICVTGLNTGRDSVRLRGYPERRLAASDDGDDSMIWSSLKVYEEAAEETEDEPFSETAVEEEQDGFFSEEASEEGQYEPLPDEGFEKKDGSEEDLNETQLTGEYDIGALRIVCLGDSLTESTDKQTAYPDVLRRISGVDVINYGVRSDTTAMIAARAGFVGLYTNEFIISAAPEPVNISIHTEGGNKLSILRYGDNGINPCYIESIKGRLSRSGGNYYFTREGEGDETFVPDGSRITTGAMAQINTDDVLVLFTGTNDSPNRKSIQDIISLQRGIIEYTGCEKYVVIGLTCKKVIPDIEAVNAAFSQEYGDNFLDIRSFMLEQGLEYEGLKETSEDRGDIENGEIPSSLRIDYVHGNKYFYDIIANMLYNKLVYLGFLPLEV